MPIKFGRRPTCCLGWPDMFGLRAVFGQVQLGICSVRRSAWYGMLIPRGISYLSRVRSLPAHFTYIFI